MPSSSLPPPPSGIIVQKNVSPAEASIRVIFSSKPSDLNDSIFGSTISARQVVLASDAEIAKIIELPASGNVERNAGIAKDPLQAISASNNAPPEANPFAQNPSSVKGSALEPEFAKERPVPEIPEVGGELNEELPFQVILEGEENLDHLALGEVYPKMLRTLKAIVSEAFFPAGNAGDAAEVSSVVQSDNSVVKISSAIASSSDQSSGSQIAISIEEESSSSNNEGGGFSGGDDGFNPRVTVKISNSSEFGRSLVGGEPLVAEPKGTGLSTIVEAEQYLENEMLSPAEYQRLEIDLLTDIIIQKAVRRNINPFAALEAIPDRMVREPMAVALRNKINADPELAAYLETKFPDPEKALGNQVEELAKFWMNSKIDPFAGQPEVIVNYKTGLTLEEVVREKIASIDPDFVGLKPSGPAFSEDVEVSEIGAVEKLEVADWLKYGGPEEMERAGKQWQEYQAALAEAEAPQNGTVVEEGGWQEYVQNFSGEPGSVGASPSSSASSVGEVPEVLGGAESGGESSLILKELAQGALVIEDVSIATEVLRVLTPVFQVVGPVLGVAAVIGTVVVTGLKIATMVQESNHAQQLDALNKKMAPFGYKGNAMLADLIRAEISVQAQVMVITDVMGLASAAAMIGGGPEGLVVGIVIAAFAGIIASQEQGMLEDIANEFAAKIDAQGGAAVFFAKDMSAQYKAYISDADTQKRLANIQASFGVAQLVGITTEHLSDSARELSDITNNSDKIKSTAVFVNTFDQGHVIAQTAKVDSAHGKIDLGPGTLGLTQALDFTTPLLTPGTESRIRTLGNNGKDNITTLQMVFPDKTKDATWTISDGADSSIFDMRETVSTLLTADNKTRNVAFKVLTGAGVDTVLAAAATLNVVGDTLQDAKNKTVDYSSLNAQSSIVVTPTANGFLVQKRLVNTQMYAETVDTDTKLYGKRKETTQIRNYKFITDKNVLVRTDVLTNVNNINGSAGNDSLTANDAGDVLNGGLGNDVLIGGKGNDTLIGGAGVNRLYGGDGDDIFYAHAGDFIDGGAGTNTIYLDGSTVAAPVPTTPGLVSSSAQPAAQAGGMAVSLTTKTIQNVGASAVVAAASAGSAASSMPKLGAATPALASAPSSGANGVGTLANIQNVVGSDQGDVITGDNNDNVLEGGAGDDVLDGSAGNDTLFGGAGTDAIFGGDGNDVIGQDLGAESDKIDGGTGINTVDYSLTDTSQRHVDWGVLVNLAQGTAAKVAVGAGVDSLSHIQNVVGTALGDRLTGDASDNLLMGGAGNDVINGADGDDTLFGGAGIDQVSGGAGNDTLRQDGGADNDKLNGGDGIDTVDYTLSAAAETALGQQVGMKVNLSTGLAQNWVASAVAAAAPIAASTATNNASVDTLVSIENVTGTDRSDQLSGDGNANIIRGAEGNDVIDGGAGDDVLYGGKGTDTVRGGDGNDMVVQDMEAVNDTLDGGIGINTLDYNFSDLSQSGKTSGVNVNLALGRTNKIATGGVDQLANFENVVGTNLADQLTGDSGNNKLWGEDAADLLNGDVGDDMLNGGNGNDQLYGGLGNDTLFGDMGDDIINGGGGDDTIVQNVSRESDQINGGDGIDTLDYSGSDDSLSALISAPGTTSLTNVTSLTSASGTTSVTLGVQVNLTTGVALKLAAGTGASDKLQNIENVEGTVLADQITGNSAANVINGGDGNDVLDGAGGNDTLFGGAGADRITGGIGDDKILEDTGLGNDQLDGGAGNDTVDYSMAVAAQSTFGVSVNLSTGQAQRLAAALGQVVAGGSDTLSNIENVIGSNLADQITGSAAANIILGGGGNDVIDGAAGNDEIFAGAGADAVQGGAGDDMIEQDLGSDNDSLDGGDGRDTVNYGVTSVVKLNPNATLGVQVNLATGLTQKLGAGAGVDTLHNIENVDGTDVADQITGNASDNVFAGGAGNDVIAGADGNDVIAGGAGADSLTGGAGDDWFEQELSTDSGSDSDSLDGGDGNDTVDYSITAVAALNANATLGVKVDLTTGLAQKLGAGTGTGIDTLTSIENVYGSVLADQISGNASNNTLTGGTGNDTLAGLGGDDVLAGGMGDDIISGGDGNDLIGQDTPSGNDQLDGGAGIDMVDYSLSVSVQAGALGVTVDLGAGVAHKQGSAGGVDTLLNIEDVVGSALADQITGSDSDNMIYGGGGNDILDGGAGNDVIYGGAGADTIQGNSGDDVLAQDLTTSEHDVLDGGIGIDTVDYSVSDLSGLKKTLGVTVNLNTGVTQKQASGGTDALANIENATGTALIDTLIGNSGSNTLAGAGGNDVINGAAGDDVLFGGDGADQLLGGDGNDLLFGDAGADDIQGGDGDDIVRQDFGQDNDKINGGDGNDTVDYSVTDLSSLSVSAGVNVDLNKGLTHKLAIGLGTSVDTLVSIENVTGTALADQIIGNAAANTIIGGAGDDVIDGGAGNDTLFGGAGADLITGGSGDDLIEQITATGNDSIDGGTGSDTVDYSQSLVALLLGVGVQVDLSSGVAHKPGSGGGVDTLVNIENVTGTLMADQISGNAAANVLNGEDGNDVINGGDGNDTLVGGAGADSMQGGNGDDCFVQDTVSGNDILNGGDGIDMVDYSQSTIMGMALGVSVNLSTGVAQKLITGGGVDSLSNIENVRGSGDADQIIGDANANLIDGGDGSDVINGGDGNDTLYGGAGADLVQGGAGDDWFKQDLVIGTDYLDGNDGNDTVAYNLTDVSKLNAALGVQVNLATGLARKVAVGGDLDILVNINNVVGSNIADQIAGDDNDNVLVGADGNDTLAGAGGNDTLYGGAGNDAIDGGDGNDLIQQELSTDSDRINGGAGSDTLSYSLMAAAQATFGVQVDLSTNLAKKLGVGGGVDTLVSIENVIGSAQNDQITGDGNANVIDGASGNDVIDGGAGDDTLYGGSGTNSVNGGDGNDALYVGMGTDSVNGGDGNDVIEQSLLLVNDTLDGGAGADTLDYSVTNLSALNVLRGVNVNLSSGITYKWATNGVDKLKNIENVIGTTLADQLTGDGGNNTLWGGAGNDLLSGGAGDDVLWGGSGADQLYGQDGNDLLEQSLTKDNDTLNGGADNDTLDYGSTDISTLHLSAGMTLGVNVNMNTGVAQKLAAGAGVDTFYNIENVAGTALDDVITGNAQDNIIRGGDGNDIINGGDGNDTLFAGAGADNVNGGAGDDLLEQNLTSNSDTLNGGNGIDTLDYSITNVSTLSAGTTLGVNVNLSTGVTQKLAAGAGVDTFSNVENVIATALADQLTGNNQNNLLVGLAGNDTMSGGGGADTYLLGRGDGQDIIIEADNLAGNTAGLNTVQWSNNVASNQLWFSRVGNDLQVSIVGTTDQVSLANWYAGDAYRAEQFMAGDGKTLSNIQVDNLVQAMAALTPPAAGQSTWSANVQASLAPVLVAWH